MHETTFRNANPKCSLSLSTLFGSRAKKLPPGAVARATAFRTTGAEAVVAEDMVSVLVEAKDAAGVLDDIEKAQRNESLEVLADGFLSANVTLSTAEHLVKHKKVTRVQTKRQSVPFLEAALPDIGVLGGDPVARVVAETGKDVLIGVIDSGFDLSHPMFRDKQGKLRVEGLLEQKANGTSKEYTAAQLETAWANGAGPGADSQGHGTHVASTAGGSPFRNRTGVAPDARFLLVKTDFLNTDKAAKWIFAKAGSAPCVINISLGHHFGAHDGTDAEERLHRALVGPGKLIVIAAGNEREDQIHIGGRFAAQQTETVTFDVLRQPDGPPFVVITLWHADTDDFDLAVLTPTGQTLAAPASGMTSKFPSALVDVTLSRGPYSWSNLTQTQIQIEFNSATVPAQRLRGWQIRMACKTAAVGRVDAWFHNSGFAVFRQHDMLEQARTVGLSATGEGCIAVASHVSKTSWDADDGAEQDTQAVVGRSSRFSSLGPTRDGRQKPDFSAPGQYVTAALADGSELAERTDRALVNQRLLTIEGTSMATPVVTGVVALMLQKRPMLTPTEARQILSATARHDAHTGPVGWNPTYGFGKIDAAAALQQTPAAG